MLSIRFFQPPAPIESFPNLSPPIFLSPQPCAKINSTLSRKRKNSPLPALPVRPLASPHAPAQTLAPPNRRTFLHLAILILISLALYAPTLRNGFVTDDKVQILQNPMVVEGKDLSQAFTPTSGTLPPGQTKSSGTTNYYRPLQPLSFTLRNTVIWRQSRRLASRQHSPQRRRRRCRLSSLSLLATAHPRLLG